MGWSSGTQLASETYALVREFIPVKKRKKIARQFYELFSDQDADDWDLEDQIIIDSGLAKQWAAEMEQE